MKTPLPRRKHRWLYKSVALALAGMAYGTARTPDVWGSDPLGPSVDSPFKPAPFKRELSPTLKTNPASGAPVTLVDAGRPTYVLMLADHPSDAARQAASLPEVDSARIGCLGLSGGGFRATYLAVMEPRINAAVITGWMTSLPTTLDIPYRVHADMFDPFGVHAYMDHPDVASLAAPDCAILVQNCGRDRLFTRAGMDSAVQKIRLVDDNLGRQRFFHSRYYDVPHQFNAEMQNDAFAWLERWLKADGG